MHSKRTITLMAGLLISILLVMLFASPQQQASARPNENYGTVMAGMMTSQARDRARRNRLATSRARAYRSLGVSATRQARIEATSRAKARKTADARAKKTAAAKARKTADARARKTAAAKARKTADARARRSTATRRAKARKTTAARNSQATADARARERQTATAQAAATTAARQTATAEAIVVFPTPEPWHPPARTDTPVPPAADPVVPTATDPPLQSQDPPPTATWTTSQWSLYCSLNPCPATPTATPTLTFGERTATQEARRRDAFTRVAQPTWTPTHTPTPNATETVAARKTSDFRLLELECWEKYLNWVCTPRPDIPYFNICTLNEGSRRLWPTPFVPEPKCEQFDFADRETIPGSIQTATRTPTPTPPPPPPGGPSDWNTATPTPTPVPPSPTPTSTHTPSRPGGPDDWNAPTNTPKPAATNTPRPTNTPKPTATRTPVPTTCPFKYCPVG